MREERSRRARRGGGREGERERGREGERERGREGERERQKNKEAKNGGGGPGLRGLGGVSDVAGMQGSGGVLTMWVSPSRGLPGSLWTLLTRVESLTSHFDGEEGFCMGIVGVGSSRSYSLFLIEN